MRFKPSLRNRLLQHVLLPLALTWLLGSVLAVSIASYFTQQALDRSLLDDAYSLASHVRHTANVGVEGLELALSSQEIETLLFDQSESVYFSVLRPDGSVLSGNADFNLHPELEEARSTPHFASLNNRGQRLRTVTLYRSQPAEFYVVMGQTTRSRDQLLQRVLVFSITPQILLLILLAMWLLRAIDADLKPLVALEQAVGQRDARDLTPVRVSASTSDVQRLGQAVNDLLFRIARSVQAQREFSGNVAHELRTPLAGIRALANYGLHHDNPNVWREQLQGIAQSEERASHLVDQLLALALADEASNDLVLKPVALDILVRETVLRYLSRADAAHVDLGATGIDQSVWVMGQTALLEGILGNFLDNALRYGLAASGERRITVSVAQGAHDVVLSVSDNGPGVPAAQLQTISQRWVQGAAGTIMKDGAGLGLAIVNAYARLMRAQVLMQHETPSGLRVSLILEKHPQSER